MDFVPEMPQIIAGCIRFCWRCRKHIRTPAECKGCGYHTSGKEEHFEPSYAVIKVNLSDKSYECLYSRHHSVYQGIKKAETYDECLDVYTDNYVHESDKDRLKAFLGSGNLTGHTSDGCQEESIFYQRRCETDADTYLWIEVKKYVDEKENYSNPDIPQCKNCPKPGCKFRAGTV